MVFTARERETYMYVLGNDSELGQGKGYVYVRWKIDGELGQEKGCFCGRLGGEL